MTDAPDRVRVTLADLSPRLRDIVADALADDADLQVVDGAIADLQVRRDLQSDVIVTEAAGQEVDGYARELLALAPRARIVVIAQHGHSATLYTLRLQKQLLPEVSPQELARAIRGTVRSF